MPDFIDRYAAKSLLPPEISREIIQGAIKYSVGMQIFKRGRNMTTGELIMPALSMLPVGGWLNSDTAIKPLTYQAWDKVEMFAEEYAARVVIPENVTNDSSYDTWGEILPRFQESYGKAFDAATFMGINKPRRFRADIVTSCLQAGAVVTSTGNLTKDISEAMKIVEMSGYNPTAIVAGVEMKSVFRANVDSTGQPIKGSFLDSLDKYYLDNGAWDSSRAMAIVGDFSQAIYAVREDMQVKISGEAATNMSDGLHSMFDEDSQVCRAKWRVGFAIPNAVNILQPNPMTRFPFAIIVASDTPVTHTVTFTVKDDKDAAVKDATIKLGDMVSKTDTTGKAVFKSQPNESYNYVIKINNKTVRKGSIDVKEADVEVNVAV